MKRSIVLLAAATALAACSPDLTVPNLNEPAAGNPATRSTIAATAQGLLASLRGLATQGVRFQGMWGRESYDLRPQEPRPYEDNLIGPRDPSSSNAGTFFSSNYRAIVNARALIASMGSVSDLTDAEKSAVSGWAETVEAYAYYQIAVNHPDFGAPAEPPANPTGELAPVETPDQLFQRSLTLFDAGMADLQNGGASFPFSFTAGMADFSTPAGFIMVNRALKARTLKYMGRWADVLSTLPQTFIDSTKDMGYGAWLDYDAGDGSANPFFNVITDYIHPRIRADAQLQPDGQPDRRVLEKLAAITATTIFNITVSDAPNMYPTASSPFPLIKNEELILIRAEAELAQGDMAGALADVNTVRVKSGGLAPLASVTGQDALLTEILYNKLYSLLFEGGFTYRDAYQYNLLDALPRALTTHVVFSQLGWPANECLARELTTGPCGSVTGS